MPERRPVAQSTPFRRTVVVLAAAAGVVQLLHPPTYFSRVFVGERPNVPTPMLRVLANLIAAGTVFWLDPSRESFVPLWRAKPT